MEYEFWFARIQGVPAQKKICLRECMKSAEAIYYIEETRLQSFEFLNERVTGSSGPGKTGNIKWNMRK